MVSMWLTRLRRILYSLALLLVCGAAFILGMLYSRPSSPDWRPLELPVTVSAPAASGETPGAPDLIEEALAARFAGEHGKALQLFDRAAAVEPSPAGLQYQRGLEFFFAGRLSEAEAAARLSVEAGEMEARSYALLVMCAAARSAKGESTDPTQVEEWAAKARTKDPLDSFVHYAMGEYSRAIGQPGQAVEHYRKALQRVSVSDALLMATVKAGLSDLRLNQAVGPEFVIPDLADESIPPEQLYFAAALALLGNDPQTAAAFLQRAREVLPPDVSSALLKDSFFQDYLPAHMLFGPQ